MAAVPEGGGGEEESVEVLKKRATEYEERIVGQTRRLSFLKVCSFCLFVCLVYYVFLLLLFAFLFLFLFYPTEALITIIITTITIIII